jgi:hypothetical protein
MRARNLKPGFFSNEQLAEVSIEARLLFAGLWCMADREGRLEYRPKRIKMQIFPADAIDVEPLISELQEQTLILMYAVKGNAYVWIPGFGKHQRPHPKEVASTLPPYPGDGRPPLPGGGIRSDVLNPDVLNPDVLNPSPTGTGCDLGADESEIGCAALADGERELELNGATAGGHTDLHADVVALWHELLPTLPRIKDWNTRRRRKLNDRIVEAKKRGMPADAPDYWRRVFVKVAASDLLCGRKTDWRCDLEWILEPKHFTKLIEGGYDNVERLRA